MLVEVTCKFHKVSIATKQAMLRTNVEYVFFFGTKGQVNSKDNSPIWPEFELVRDFMPVQVYLQVSIETKQAMLRRRSNMGIFSTKGQVTPK